MTELEIGSEQLLVDDDDGIVAVVSSDVKPYLFEEGYATCLIICKDKSRLASLIRG